MSFFSTKNGFQLRMVLAEQNFLGVPDSKLLQLIKTVIASVRKKNKNLERGEKKERGRESERERKRERRWLLVGSVGFLG